MKTTKAISAGIMTCVLALSVCVAQDHDAGVDDVQAAAEKYETAIDQIHADTEKALTIAYAKYDEDIAVCEQKAIKFGDDKELRAIQKAKIKNPNACSSRIVPPGQGASAAGTWATAAGQYQSFVWKFKANGTCTADATTGGQQLQTNGTWTQCADVIVAKMENGQLCIWQLEPDGGLHVVDDGPPRPSPQPQLFLQDQN